MNNSISIPILFFNLDFMSKLGFYVGLNFQNPELFLDSRVFTSEVQLDILKLSQHTFLLPRVKFSSTKHSTLNTIQKYFYPLASSSETPEEFRFRIVRHILRHNCVYYRRYSHRPISVHSPVSLHFHTLLKHLPSSFQSGTVSLPKVENRFPCPPEPKLDFFSNTIDITHTSPTVNDCCSDLEYIDIKKSRDLSLRPENFGMVCLKVTIPSSIKVMKFEKDKPLCTLFDSPQQSFPTSHPRTTKIPSRFQDRLKMLMNRRKKRKQRHMAEELQGRRRQQLHQKRKGKCVYSAYCT